VKQATSPPPRRHRGEPCTEPWQDTGAPEHGKNTETLVWDGVVHGRVRQGEVNRRGRIEEGGEARRLHHDSAAEVAGPRRNREATASATGIARASSSQERGRERAKIDLARSVDRVESDPGFGLGSTHSSQG
jgi:hypothetical protein